MNRYFFILGDHPLISAAEIYSWLKKEKIRLEEFRVKSLPIKPKGDERDLLVFPKNLMCKFEKDELNKNKISLYLVFV